MKLYKENHILTNDKDDVVYGLSLKIKRNEIEVGNFYFATYFTANLMGFGYLMKGSYVRSEKNLILFLEMLKHRRNQKGGKK